MDDDLDAIIDILNNDKSNNFFSSKLETEGI